MTFLSSNKSRMAPRKAYKTLPHIFIGVVKSSQKTIEVVHE